MNTIVFIKAVPDNTRLRWEASGPVLADWMMNPLDEYALEAALQLKTATGGKLTVISLGANKDHLKKCVALGADAICAIDPLDNSTDHQTRAKALATAAQQLDPEATLWLCGQQALDSLAGMTGPLLAAIQGWPWLGGAKALQSGSDGLQITAEQQGQECDIVASGPVVVSFIKGVTELRTPNIKGVMAANRADIPVKTLADLGISLADNVPTPTVTQRPVKAAGRLVKPDSPQDAATQLVNYLKSEGFR
jgi:electron transfer flavoprotein beta subunit